MSSGLAQGALESASSPTAATMGALFERGIFANVIILGGIAGILTSWNALLVGGSRVLYAMSESGMLPAWLSRLHPRYGTPSNATLFIDALSLAAPLFGEAMLNWLVNAGSFNIVIAYPMVVVSFLMLRRNEPQMERPFRAGRSPAVGLVALALILGLVVLYVPGLPSALAWPEWLIIALWWMAGLVLILKMKILGLVELLRYRFLQRIVI